jgi:hypothetical protein
MVEFGSVVVRKRDVFGRVASWERSVTFTDGERVEVGTVRGCNLEAAIGCVDVGVWEFTVVGEGRGTWGWATEADAVNAWLARFGVSLAGGAS